MREKWNEKTYEGDERRLYKEERYEYRIAVDWDTDCDRRENPLPINGRLPYGPKYYSEVKPGRRWDVQSVLQDLRKRTSPE